MTILTLKSTAALTFVGLATVVITACNSGQPTAVETQPPAAVVAGPPVAQPAVFKAGEEPSVTLAAHYDVAAASALANQAALDEGRRNELQVMRTTLNEATSAANVRRGPGIRFDAIGTIDDSRTIVVTGRAADSDWLRIEFRGETAWLAGDLIAHHALIHLLPVVDTSHLVPALADEEVEVVAEPEAETDTETLSEAEQETAAMKRLRPLRCAETPIRGFGQVWRNQPEVRPLLGCPFTNFRRDEHATPAAVQTFQGGWMLWLETDTVQNIDPIYVFFNEPNSYIRFGDRELVDAHSYGSTPRGFYKIGDRFAKVYWEELTAQQRNRLGLATNEARDSNGAFQEFAHGRMFWAGEADTIYIIYEGAYDFDGDGQTIWRRGWNSFEDTFEAGATE